MSIFFAAFTEEEADVAETDNGFTGFTLIDFFSSILKVGGVVTTSCGLDGRSLSLYRLKMN